MAKGCRVMVIALIVNRAVSFQQSCLLPKVQEPLPGFELVIRCLPEVGVCVSVCVSVCVIFLLCYNCVLEWLFLGDSLYVCMFMQVGVGWGEMPCAVLLEYIFLWLRG